MFRLEDKMKHKMSLILFCTLIVLMVGGNQAAGVSAGNTAFPYEGYLAENGHPANGIYDFQFTLYDASNNGNPIGNVIPREDIAVDNGQFNVLLDFGAGAFNGEARWLEMGARPGNSTGQYTPHPPRQELGPAPWSEFPGGGRSAHDHLGQTWTGSDPLVINGTYENAPLVLSNDIGVGLRILNAGRHGVVVNSAGTNGFRVNSSGTAGFYVESAGAHGLYVGNAGVHGVDVGTAGNVGFSVGSTGDHGLYVGNAGVHGVAVDSANNVGLYVGYAGDHGLYVVNAGVHGVAVDSAGAEGLYVGSAGDNGLYVGNAGNTGVAVDSANYTGLWVGSAGGDGLHVGNAGNNGITVDSAFDGVVVESASHTGFGVRSAGGDGLWVDHAGDHGVAVYSASNDGILVGSAGGDGLYVGNAGNNGVHVDSAGGYAGWFGGSIYARDGCVGCTITMFGVNAGSVPLQPGDIVSIQGLLPSNFAEAATLMQVKAAEKGETVIGVVQGRAEVNRETNPLQGNSQDRLVPGQGAVEPGDYVTIIIYGPAQVKASALSGSISAGTRLTLGDDGGVRTLKTTEVNGVQIAESASTIGIALEGPGDNGVIWVLINPQ
jgi:hypothetical protein